MLNKIKTEDGRTIPTRFLSSISDGLSRYNKGMRKGHFIIKNVQWYQDSKFQVDFELLALELTDDQYNEYLEFNNSDTIKCCWSDTDSKNRGL